MLIKSTQKADAEALLLEELLKGADAWSAATPIMGKVTIPTATDLYAPLIAHDKVLRVVALCGGYSLADGCVRLSDIHGMIASFSRALVDGLTHGMSDAAFDAELTKHIDVIYAASTEKR